MHTQFAANWNPLCRADRRRGSLLSTAAVLVLAASGCGVHEPALMTAGDSAIPCDPLAGCWEGMIESNAHRPPRPVRVTFVPESGEFYRAEYRTSVALGLPARLQTTHQVRCEGSTVEFDGEVQADLIGAIRFHARGSGSTLRIRYEAEGRTGTLYLRRSVPNGSASGVHPLLAGVR